MGMGLATGFAAALFLALSYVFSGMSVRRFAGVSPVSLLCRSHLVMGALSLGHVGYDRWFRYVWKLILYFLVLTVVFLALGTVLS